MRQAKEIFREILKQRGIEDKGDISEFLSGRPQKTYDPFLLLNMEAGVDLLLSEIKSGSKICIYGDYDADGVTSICIMMSVLSSLTDNISYYIPSRIEEGYGLNKEAIDKIRAQGTELLITVDCGSVSYGEVEHAKSLGMKVIVTDHHSIDDVKADCILINPKQKECSYPFKSLAGCGVAFKFVQAVQKKTAIDSGLLHSVLDLVSIGTVGDVVSLQDENRTLVKYGLSKINSGSRQSIRALADAASIKYVTSEAVAFSLAPRINAAGRMAHAGSAVELLMSEDAYEIRSSVCRLVEYNNSRKGLQEKAYKECSRLISEDEDIIILKMEHMHEGIGGIVAGKLKESFYRPVMLLTPSGKGFLKGTGRSIPGIDIYRLLKNNEELFTRFGGHEGACGFTMAEGMLPQLRASMNRDMQALIKDNPSVLEKKQEWDMELEAEEITLELARELMLLEPCGEGNGKPLFCIRNILPRDIKFMGSEGQHVKFKPKTGGTGNVECVYFGAAQEKKHLFDGEKRIDIVGRISLHVWRGSESVQFIIEEIL